MHCFVIASEHMPPNHNPDSDPQEIVPREFLDDLQPPENLGSVRFSLRLDNVSDMNDIQAVVHSGAYVEEITFNPSFDEPIEDLPQGLISIVFPENYSKEKPRFPDSLRYVNGYALAVSDTLRPDDCKKRKHRHSDQSVDHLPSRFKRVRISS